MLHDVVESVAKGDTEYGVIPFYNTTKKSIEESQIELVKQHGKVCICDVLPFNVRHYLCGYGNVSDVRELHTKSVVFHQASDWIHRNLPTAKQVDCPSTSLAVKATGEKKDPAIAAIGTKSACKNYGVPVIKGDIQNKPNITLFFLIHNGDLQPDNVDHVLMCLPNATDKDKDAIADVVAENDCSISSNWNVRLDTGSFAYFFEINGRYSTLDLHSTVTIVGRSFKRKHVFICGGYKEKCITSLIWGIANSKARKS